MKVIAQWNQKGGVGKTTATGSIGAGLAKRGFKTLMIDADPQGNLTTWLAPENAAADLRMVIEGKSDPENTVYYVEENLYILPTAENSSLREVEFGKLLNDQRYFARKNGFFGVLSSMNFDFVLIDNAPAWSRLEFCLAHIMDEVNIIVEPEAFSFQGFAMQKETIGQASEICEKNIEWKRTIVSKMNASIGVHNQALEALKNNLDSENIFVARQDAEIKKMQREKKHPFSPEYEKCKANSDFSRIVNSIIGDRQ